MEVGQLKRTQHPFVQICRKKSRTNVETVYTGLKSALDWSGRNKP